MEMDYERSEEFTITNDQLAEWALGKIRDAKAEIEKWDAYYDERKEANRKEQQNTIDYFTHLLFRYFDTVPHKVTKGGTEKYPLPGGELIRKPAAIAYEKDEMALLEWCEKNLPEAVKVSRKAGWAEVKAYIQETGELPVGVVPYEKEPEFQVKEAKV